MHRPLYWDSREKKQSLLQNIVWRAKEQGTVRAASYKDANSLQRSRVQEVVPAGERVVRVKTMSSQEASELLRSERVEAELV